MIVKRRLFFGVEIHAPWPTSWPKGRVIEEQNRHCTLVFLGKTEMPDVARMPKPPFQVGSCGWFDRAVCLPEHDPRVIAWHIRWRNNLLADYQAVLSQWFKMSSEPWLSHTTVCRDPAHPNEWLEQFSPLPCVMGSLHLYESLGHSKYQPVWSHALTPPFVEFEHTADVAFHITGATLQDLYAGAFTALAYKCPDMLQSWQEQSLSTLEEVITALNRAVCRTDAAVGCPFKAVSFHGQIAEVDGLLHWDMIVDV